MLHLQHRITAEETTVATKLNLLAQADFEGVQAEIEDVHARCARLAKALGPAYGATWTEKVVHLMRGMRKLKGQLEARFYAQSASGTAAALRLPEDFFPQPVPPAAVPELIRIDGGRGKPLEIHGPGEFYVETCSGQTVCVDVKLVAHPPRLVTEDRPAAA
jgi:hypothetical protein